MLGFLFTDNLDVLLKAMNCSFEAKVGLMTLPEVFEFLSLLELSLVLGICLVVLVLTTLCLLDTSSQTACGT